MKYEHYSIGGKVVKEDDRYTVIDNNELKNLILSSTRLNAGKSTSGHNHYDQEEIYFFVSGTGEMELDGERFVVREGDTVLIHDGVFHRVHNTSNAQLYFVCVFDGKRNH